MGQKGVGFHKEGYGPSAPSIKIFPGLNASNIFPKE
jgi:hypothetical protein